MHISQAGVLLTAMLASTTLAGPTPGQKASTATTTSYTVSCSGRMPNPKIMLTGLCFEPQSSCVGSTYHAAQSAERVCEKCSCVPNA
ncbi:hypothetical protein JDV02_000825 [Purpureocillium takamizusanense]|uniref:Uncharacterized protein n=1 Tax=Purpureocillium takamizusanense TaxID=2060973 RepID=A0A9Q8V788_9HYPO|nr:uncharacterized protein JDV02_000825 [Purpureocillium takamizusanense]UNI14166.1 hypothetical protein JDV02_000825 [Purpureocillium takamizusanense]